MEQLLNEFGALVIGLVPTVLSGYILHRLKKMDAKNDAYYESRKKEAYLIMQSFDSGAELAIITAEKLKDIDPGGEHTINGNLDAAIDRRKEIKKEYDDYIKEEAAAHKVRGA